MTKDYNYKKMKKQLIIYVLCIVSSYAWSQQDAQYSQYMYNMNVINPAYTTGDVGAINFGLLHRSQWVGIDGGPVSTNLFAHAPISQNIELGLNVVSDKLGEVVQENNITADFAYRLPLDRFSTLSFGLKAGVNLLDVSLNGLNLESGSASSDPRFSDDINKSLINIGAGVYYNTDKFYFGVSIPNIMKGKHLDTNAGKLTGSEVIHYYITSGYVFDINSDFKFKPSFLVKATNGAPITYDINANLLYKNKLEFGLGYRSDDEIGAMVNLRVLPELRLGYAYDYTTSDLNEFSSGSHEFIILYDFNTLFNGFNKSPRFF